MKLPRRPGRRAAAAPAAPAAPAVPAAPTPAAAPPAIPEPSAPEAAPGWDAIEAALAPHYGAVPARHVAFTPPSAFSLNLQGCSAYAADGHWCFVTFGLSELFETELPAEPGPSGHGFELTMRTPRGDEPGPPDWPYAMLNELGKQVRGKGVPIEPGDRVDLRAPVTGHPKTDGPPSQLTVFAFRVDPVLEPIETPQGSVRFVQVVGVTAAEKAQMLASSTETVLTQLAWADPLLVLDPARGAS
ncbi:MAG: hypothetical protein QOG60_632 [Frankiaceae bacterium]|nr:hypothetical protein [Frankiaceae bacterium]